LAIKKLLEKRLRAAAEIAIEELRRGNTVNRATLFFGTE